jgi:hypothetical protein
MGVNPKAKSWCGFFHIFGSQSFTHPVECSACPITWFSRLDFVRQEWAYAWLGGGNFALYAEIFDLFQMSHLRGDKRFATPCVLEYIVVWRAW